MTRFFLDQAISPKLGEWLRAGGHDAVHVREIGLSRAADVELVALAVQERRVIVTADLDFSRILALSRSHEPGLVLFRSGSLTDADMQSLMERVLERVPEPELHRSVVVLDRRALRIARLPLKVDPPK